MQTGQTITFRDHQLELIPEQITPESINAKAVEMANEGGLMIRSGVRMVEIAIELGAMLETKANDIIRKGGDWSKWQKEHLSFSVQSASNYRRLFRNRDKIASALDAGSLSSIRQAIAIISAEPGMQDTLPGLQDKRKVEPSSKTEGIFSKLWRIFREPSKAPEPEKRAFIAHTSEAVKLCKEQGWELIGVNIEIGK